MLLDYLSEYRALDIKRLLYLQTVPPIAKTTEVIQGICIFFPQAIIAGAIASSIHNGIVEPG